VKRRELLAKAGALGVVVGGGGLAFAQAKPAGKAAGKPGPNDKIGVGFIGVGGMGHGNLNDFLKNPDVNVVGVCDVFQTNLDKAMATATAAGAKPKAYNKDYRQLLADPDVDAVVISTPEHWHALMCIDACEAGKDVYVEKPASHNIRDGRLMVEAARRKSRVVQVGSQQRSGAHFQRAVRYIRDKRIGDVYYATCWNHTPPSTPKPKVVGGPPPGMDWDMWLGPAPVVPYDKVINYGRRGLWDFWGGMLTEWGAHLADIVLWAMNAGAPQTVVAAGGRFHKKQGEIPDTLQVSYKYPNFLFHYSVMHHNTYGLNGDVGAARFGSYGIQFHGTKGTLFIDRSGFRITPQVMRQEEANQPAPRATTDSKQPGFYYTTAIMPETSDSSEQHWPHVRNFLDCVKSRKRPNADIEDGHLANTVCRLGNIAYRTGRAIRWDAAREQIVDDNEAQRLAIGEYRDPWKPRGV
jgi:predicted dehydrogenase